MNADERYASWATGFRILLRESKMTQEEFGKKVGAAREHINAIVNNRKRAGPDLQDAISSALGKSYDEVRDLGREALGLPKTVEVRQCLYPIYSGAAADAPPAAVAQTGEVNREAVVNVPENVVQNGVNNGVMIAVRESPTVNGDSPDGLLTERVTQNPDVPQQQPRSAPVSDTWMEPEHVDVPKITARLNAKGGFIMDENPHPHHFRTEWLNRVCRHYTQALLLDWEDDSMEPAIRDGDTVIIDRSADSCNIKDGKVYALRTTDAILLKRLRRTSDSKVRVVSDNKEACPEEVKEPNDIEIIGQVVWRGGTLK